jgi:alanine adding enzyme
MQDYSFTELSPEDFEAFVSMQKCDNFLQSREMYDRYQTAKREAYILGLKDSKNRIVLAALVVKINSIKNQKVFSAPGGPVLNYEKSNALSLIRTFLASARPFLKKRHGLALQISPNTIVKPGDTSPKLSGTKYLGEYTQCKWISTLDLSQFSSPEELFKTFRKGHRYSIKYTDTRFHLETRELSRDELPILKSLAEKAAEKHSFHDQSLSYYESMFDAFGDKLKVLAAFYEGKPVAAAMFVYYGHEVVYLYSGADPEYNHVAGSYALQWKMINFAFGHNFKRYNFYGVRPETGNGVFEFKNGFRASVEELWGTYIFPLSPLGKLYVARKKYHKYGDLS